MADTIWLTQQKRIDLDKAIFGEMSYDVTDKLTATGGLRVFKSENSLEGLLRLRLQLRFAHRRGDLLRSTTDSMARRASI